MKIVDNKKFLPFLLGAFWEIFCFFYSCHTAQADWGSSGAKYACSKSPGIFELLPHDQTSEDPNPDPGLGFTALPDGISKLKCRLGKRKLEVNVDVTPPQSRGMCMGSGAVDIPSIVVDGIELLDNGIRFNWSCVSEEDPVVKIKVQTSGLMVDLEECTAKASMSEETGDGPKCSKKSFDIQAIAAANAKVDHNLADFETQDRESAKRLPPENDLASVFSMVQTGSKIPLCSHWHSTFVDYITAPDQQRYSRISGTAGERVYIHPTNPQLCQNTNDDGCTPSAYVLPGDRIDIGFICGDWTQIQYRSRIRTKPPVKGWVETARIYGLPSIFKKEMPSISVKPPLQPLKFITDPLFSAVAAHNPELVESMITAGANPNGADEDGYPLAAAVQNADITMVNTLIRLGANPNADPPDKAFKCRILSLSIENAALFEILAKAGLDLNCRNGNNGETQLIKIANYNRLWAWERIHKKGYNKPEHLLDPLALAKQLLLAGADPNARTNGGKTALFYVAQANNIDVAELLFTYGADPNIAIDSRTTAADQTGSTPLMEAYHWYSLTYDPTLFQLLLTHGANPNFRNSSIYNPESDETTKGAVTFAGQTVLTRASADGHFTLVRLLLENGADPTVPRADGTLPETIAQTNNHQKIAELIASYTKQR